MTDELDRKRLIIERKTIATGEMPREDYDTMLSIVSQAIYEFRSEYGRPDDPELPVTLPYESDSHSSSEPTTQ